MTDGMTTADFEAFLHEQDEELQRVKGVIGAVSFPGYEFLVDEVVEGYSIRVRYMEPDVMTGVVEEQLGRVWFVPAGQTNGQLVQTCFKALMTSLEHRARENFLYRGKPVLQPHLDIDQLWAMMPDRHTHQTAVEFDRAA